MNMIDLMSNPGRAGARHFDVAYCAVWKPRITWPGHLFRDFRPWKSADFGVAPVMTPFGPCVAEWDAPYGGGDAVVRPVRRRSDCDLMGYAIKLASELGIPILVEERGPECQFSILCPPDFARTPELWALANPHAHPGDEWKTFLHHQILWSSLLTPEWQAALDARLVEARLCGRCPSTAPLGPAHGGRRMPAVAPEPIPVARRPDRVRVCGGSRRRRRAA